MALSDWQEYSIDDGDLVLEVLDPISGTGSGYTRVPGSSEKIAADLSAKAGATLGVTYGVTKGAIRTLIKPSVGGQSGIFCLTDEVDLVNNPVNCYTFTLHNLTNDFHLVKWTNTILTGYTGTPSGGPIHVLETAGPWVDDVTIPIQFEWIVNSPSSVQFFARVGTQLDFSDLSLLFYYEDTSSPFVTTLSEGIYAIYSGGAARTRFDNTSLFSISL